MKTLIYLSLLILLASCRAEKPSYSFANQQRIKEDLQTITRKFGFRDYLHIKNLNNVADYIFNEFSKVCDTVYFQEFRVDNHIYKNVIASLFTQNTERIIVGAHYDACGQQEGADDNASGTTGLLELARLLEDDSLQHQIDFVAYTLEEPPHFGTKDMGSYVHAQSVFNQKQNIKGMICLEMIGYFNDSAGSQTYPIGLLKPFYGNKGDYITIVEKFGSGKFSKKFRNLMQVQNQVKTKAFKGPQKLQGIDFSDHRNYWKFGFDAVMVTNTAFYRNDNYHQITDKIETLDLNRMCKVIDQVYISIKCL